MIPCQDQVQHRSEWALLDLDWCRESWLDYGRPTPGAHTVACPVCQVAWRSRAKYVRELPQLRPTWIARLLDEQPLLAELSYWTEEGALAGYNRFLHSLAYQLYAIGSLSDRQIEVGQQVIRDHVERMNWMLQHADRNA